MKRQNSAIKLTVLVCALFLGAQNKELAAQNRGFFFGGGGGYLWDAKTSSNMGDKEYMNRFQSSVEGFLFLGFTTTKNLDFALEAAVAPKTYYLQDGGALTPVSYTHIPVLFKAYYATTGIFALKPNIFAGFGLDIMKDEPTTNQAGVLVPGEQGGIKLGYSFGAGLDISLALPGDQVSLFAGFSYVVYVPLDADIWYHYPMVRGGVSIYPFNTKRQVASNFGPHALNPEGNALLEEMRMAEREYEMLMAQQVSLAAVARNDSGLTETQSIEEAQARKLLDGSLAEVGLLKKEVTEQIAILNEESLSNKDVLKNLKQSTNGVKTVQLNGGSAENPILIPGAEVETIYFFPDATQNLVAYSIPVLDEVGKKLRSDPGLVVSIRGYAAPAGTLEGRMVVSESRARYCAEYFNKNFGIPYNRMQIEWFGAAKKTAQNQSYSQDALNRAVELVVWPKSAAQ